MIPDTTHLEQDGPIVIWRNDEFTIPEAAATAIAAEVRRLADREDTLAVFVDNREADGVWPEAVASVWADLMVDLDERGVRCAMVTPTVTNTMQVDRLASEAGVDDEVKAFSAEEYQDAVAFVRGAVS